MSRLNSPYANDHQSEHPSQQHLHFPAEEEDNYKASYDDLVDQYAEPYGASTRHQTFNLQSSGMAAGQQQRKPTIPAFHQKQSFSSEHSARDTEEGMTPSAPRIIPMKVDKELDTRTFWQKVLPESIACRLYVLTVLVQTGVDLAIEADLFLRFHEAGDNQQNPDANFSNTKMPVYLGIFALAHVFQFAMAVDAVYARNTLQFISLTIFNALFLVYAVIQITEIQNYQALLADTKGISHLNLNVLIKAIPIVISVAEVVYIALAWKIYQEFGWKVYKFLGADRRIKKMFANYQVYQCLVKFDVFFWVGFSVQYIWLVLNNNDWEYWVTCAALPLSIILLVEGHLAARHENKWMMYTFMSGCVSALVYFVYKLIRTLMYKSDSSNLTRQNQYLSVWKSLTTFSVIAIILLLVTFAFSIVILRNFGRGLKNTMAKNNAHVRWGSQTLHHRAMSLNPNRMSIE